MNRKKFITNSLLGLAGLATLPTYLYGKSTRALALQAESKLLSLRGGVHVFTMSGGSMGVYLSDGHSIIIDSQYPDNAKEALKQLKEKGLAEKMMLCNTHHHGDHTGGNDIFAEAGMSILAHKAVPELMKKQAEERNRPLAALPTTTFETSLNQEIGAEMLNAKHFGAGHTGGDAVFHFEEANIAHVGDLVFNDVYPFIDPNGGGSIAGWIEVLKGIEAYYDAETLFIFGHGKEITGSLKDVVRKRQYLEKLLEEARKAVAAGVAKENFENNENLVFEGRNEMWNGAKSMNLARAWEQASAMK